MLLTAAKGGEKIGEQGPHKIQGMGAGLVPKVLDLDILDEVYPVHSDDAMQMAHELWMIGLPVGVSAGAIVKAAVEVCKRPESQAKSVWPSFHPLESDTLRTQCLPKSRKRQRISRNSLCQSLLTIQIMALPLRGANLFRSIHCSCFI